MESEAKTHSIEDANERPKVPKASSRCMPKLAQIASYFLSSRWLKDRLASVQNARRYADTVDSFSKLSASQSLFAGSHFRNLAAYLQHRWPGMRRGGLMRSDEEMYITKGPLGHHQPSSIRIRSWQRISLVFAHPLTPYISVDAIAEGVQGNIAPKNRCRCPFRGAEAARCCLDPPNP